MELSAEERAAILRFVDFEVTKLEAAEDEMLMILHAALYRLNERDPKRMARLLAAASSLLGLGTPIVLRVPS
jgi:hypothetical protein